MKKKKMDLAGSMIGILESRPGRRWRYIGRRV